MRPVVFRCGELFCGSRCVGVDLLWGGTLLWEFVAGNCSGCVVVRSCRRCGRCSGGGYCGVVFWKFIPGHLFGWLSGSFVRRISSGCPSALPLHFGITRSPMPDPDVFLCVFWRLPGCRPGHFLPVTCPYDADFSAPARIFEQAIVFMYIFAGRRQTIT